MTAAESAGLVEYRPSGEPHVHCGRETVKWGYLSSFEEPVVCTESGSLLMMDTVSHEGLMPEQGPPREFFIRMGIAAPQVLEDAIAIYANVQHSAMGPHIITGPIEVRGAMPGDVLKVEIESVTPRVPYGVNAVRTGKGALPDEFTLNRSILLPLDLDRGVARFNDEIAVPLAPFFGLMATAPPRSLRRAHSGPPGPFGGNLDIKHLTAGSILYLPIHAPGALFMVGDGHAAQGNGEVNVTAIETSLCGEFRLTVLKGASLTWPRAETPTHYITIGVHEDLNEAMRIAVRETIKFLVDTRGLSALDAYSLASIGVDFEISQVVNGVKGVHGMIPKCLFSTDRG